MTSFPVGIKTLIAREWYEMDEKLLQNANSKLESAFQKTRFSTSLDAPLMPKSWWRHFRFEENASYFKTVPDGRKVTTER